jgi:hypothetical protein
VQGLQTGSDWRDGSRVRGKDAVTAVQVGVPERAELRSCVPTKQGEEATGMRIQLQMNPHPPNRTPEPQHPHGNASHDAADQRLFKEVESLQAAYSLWFAYYNFCRVHTTLRVTPAMEAGLSDHVWSVEELVSLMPEPQAKKRDPYKKRNGMPV